MNSKLMFLLAVGGAALIFAADQPKKEATEFDKLKAKVEVLEGRVQLLEAKLQAISQTQRTAFEAPRLRLTPENVPPNIGEIEVNGLKVYKVPLTATAK
jgi:hypothetical protein